MVRFCLTNPHNYPSNKYKNIKFFVNALSKTNFVNSLESIYEISDME